MAIIDRIPKSPAEVLTLTLDWSQILAAAENITSVLFFVDAGLTSAGPTFTNKTVSIVLSGGTAGVDYKVVSRVTTSLSDTIEESVWATVRVA